VSVADVVTMPGGDGARGEFDRTPPQDIVAEQSVLGGMLLSKDAIADVVEVLKPGDFYRPPHQTIYDTVLDLYGRGEPADPVTVSAELTREGLLAKIGGAPYLHTLIASVPTAANAGYYAQIVRERAILRRLVEAGTRIVQLGYGASSGMGGDVDDIVDRAQQEVYDVTERRTSEDYVRLEEVLQDAFDEIEAMGSRGSELYGVPTGFRDLDELTNGLHPGQLIVVAGRPAMGKALALDTPLATPTGWTTMGEVRVGDELIGADGHPTRVVAATEVMTDRPCFEVEFSDGSVIVADAMHQWVTTTRRRRKSGDRSLTVVTTAEMASSARVEGRANHAVPVATALSLPEAELPVDPYVLGVWLGDGETAGGRITTADAEIVLAVQKAGYVVARGAGRYDYGVRGLRVQLRDAGVLGDKHVPASYLRASEEQRRQLLAGLLDTDGSVANGGLSVRFEATCRRLAESVHELITSLGYRCRMTTKPVPGRSADGSTCYRLTFTPADKVFALTRKLGRQTLAAGPHARLRYVVDVRPAHSVPVRCVQVDNEDHLYLAGRSMIPTHNSTIALDALRAASIRHGQTSAVFSLEMSRNEITMRLLSAEARILLKNLRTGGMTDDDWNRLARKMGEIADAPLFIDDSPNLSMMEIRAKARRLKQRNDLKLIVVDYLQLMSSPKKVESRQQEVAEMSRALKLLAKELEVPVIAVSQLNRGPEQRQDKRPQLADLRESGAIEQDADMVILLHREDFYEKESPRAGEADLIVAKHRNGPTGTIVVSSQLHYSRFVDMQQS
jgi:replicative DNA helicase